MKSNYEERKSRRIERFKELAAKNEAKSDQEFKRASEMASIIPLGQPILVGHHSEKKDRNYRNRIDNVARQGVASGRKAEYYEEKARAAENNTAISSDDPEALAKLKDKLDAMQALQELMKATNKIVKNKKLSHEDKVASIVELGVKEVHAANLLQSDYCGRVGFPSYRLQNNNQNITRVKMRIKELESTSTMVSAEVMIGDVKILTNVEDNRVQLFFPGKPDETVRTELKRKGFRWSPSVGAWQRQLSNRATYYAFEIVNGMIKPKEGE